MSTSTDVLKIASWPLLAALTFSLPAVANSDEDASFSRYTSTSPAHDAGYQRALASDGRYRITTNFPSFGGDPLQVNFTLSASAAAESAREFGVSNDELDVLVRECSTTPGCGQAEMDRRTQRYYNERGLRLRNVPGKAMRLYVDVPMAAHRNRARVQPVASALQRLADEHGQDAGWAVHAAIALVQTGLPYRQPSSWDEGRRIVGFYPPARALERGYGDCDTKSALLAAILLNLGHEGIIGVRVPQHYLLGIAGTPEPGQAAIEHRGRVYVLVEAAGPALRRPGDIAERTQAALRRPDEIRIDPIL